MAKCSVIGNFIILGISILVFIVTLPVFFQSFMESGVSYGEIAFLLFPTVFLILSIVRLYRFLIVTFCGRRIEGIVYGYIRCSQTNSDGYTYYKRKIKILVNSNDGPKFIYYGLLPDRDMYDTGTKVNLKVYKDLFLIFR